MGGAPARARLRGRGGGARALAVRRLAGPSRGRAGRPHQRRSGAADRRARSRRAVPDQARRPTGDARGHLAARGHGARLRSRGRRRGGELGGHAADGRRARRGRDPRRPRLGAGRGPGDRSAAADRHRRRWSAGSSPARAPARRTRTRPTTYCPRSGSPTWCSGSTSTSTAATSSSTRRRPRRAAAATPVRRTSSPPPSTSCRRPGRSPGWRNLAYAIEWWIFGAFALFLWWRFVRDAVAPRRQTSEEADADRPVGSAS